MPLPKPVRGLVVRYEFLWADEARRGITASKERPACLLLLVEQSEGTRVFYCPVTHSPPADPSRAVEIPAEEKRQLGLDDGRSWIVPEEVNEDLWPKGLRHIPGTPSRFVYGRISHSLLVEVAAVFQRALRDRTLRRTPRP